MVFKAKQRISEQAARKMILAMAYHGNHFHDLQGHIRTVSDVKAHYSQNGYEFGRVVGKCRNFSETVPMYENLLGAQWLTAGVTVSRQNPLSAEYEPIVSGDGFYNESNYWANFEISRDDFDLAIRSGRWERFLSAVNAGIAAIEAFLNHQYIIRLVVHSDDMALRASLADKLKNWPSHLTGQSFDLSDRSWQSFCTLKQLRDADFQHRKTITTGLNRKEHLRLLNEYRFAIPLLLMNLHIHFGVRCPSAIIRYTYFPEIDQDEMIFP